MTELVGSGWEKRCEYFVVLNVILNIAKMENFAISHSISISFKHHWVALTLINASFSAIMHCPGLAIAWTCTKPVLNGSWLCHTCPYTNIEYRTLGCQPCPKSARGCTALTDLVPCLTLYSCRPEYDSEFIHELLRISAWDFRLIDWLISYFRSSGNRFPLEW